MSRCEECGKIDLLVHCDCNKDVCEECFENNHFMIHRGVKIIGNSKISFNCSGFYSKESLEKLK